MFTSQFIPNSTNRSTHVRENELFKPLKRPLQPSEYILPLRRDADEFILCFWNFVHPVFPILDKCAFNLQYESLWMSGSRRSFQEDDRIFLASFNIVVALGSLYSSCIPSDERDMTASQLFERSLNTYKYDIFDAASLSTVRLLLLTAVYLQSSNSPGACWNAVGLAIRLAQTIGLHAESDNDKRRPYGELQLRRRLWHVCISLDRYILS